MPTSLWCTAGSAEAWVHLAATALGCLSVVAAAARPLDRDGLTAENPPLVIEQPTADFSVKPTLTGTRVVLRPFVIADDLPAIRSALHDPEVVHLTGSAPMTPEDEERTVRWYETRNEQTDRLDLAVVDRASGGCVGEAVLSEWDDENRSCNFRILLGPAGRDRGLGTKATRLIVGYGFERLALQRISLEVFAFNPRARRVYEKVGFVAQGPARGEVTVMAIHASGWSRHHGKPEAAWPG